MTLLADLFGMGGQAPQQSLDAAPDELLRRALRLNDGIVTPQALAAQAQNMAPMEPVRELQSYVNQGGQYEPTAARATVAAQPAPVAAPAPTTAPANDPSVWDRMGGFARGYQSGGLIGAIAESAGGVDRTRQTENLTIKTLMDKGGLSAEQATAIARNPALMQAALPQIFGNKTLTLKPGEKVTDLKGSTIADNFEQARPQVVQQGASLIGPTGTVMYDGSDNTKLQPGWMRSDTGGLIPIPGGPADPAYIQEVSGIKKDPPAGYEWVDPANKSKGLSAIAGGPAEKIGAEMAGKIALMDAARPGIMRAKKILTEAWGPGGVIQSAAANMPLIGDISALSGDIGIAQRDVRAGIEAALRVMTGAAAPETEVTRYARMFMPGVKDTEQSAKQKLQLLEDFMDNARSIATQGRVPTKDKASSTHPSAAISEARDAIARGADRRSVIERLRKSGIDPTGLD